MVLAAALLTLLLGQEFSGRNVLVSVFVMVWAVRLAGACVMCPAPVLLPSNAVLEGLGYTRCAKSISVFISNLLSGFLLFRVLKTGSDTRFDDIRSHFFKFFGKWYSFDNMIHSDMSLGLPGFWVGKPYPTNVWVMLC